MIDCSVNGTPRGRAPYPQLDGRLPTSQPRRPLRQGRRPGRRPGRCAGPAPARPTACAPPSDADAATGERAAALARELVKQLGQHARRRDEDRPGALDRRLHRDPASRSARSSRQTLAALRDDVPPLPFKKVEKLLEERARRPGRRPLRRLRGGGVRRRLDRPGPPRGDARRRRRSRSRSSTRASPRRSRPTCATSRLLLPLVKRLAPGLDVKALSAELRERIAEELDYEIEAQNHRAMARAWRGHPFVLVPTVDTEALEPPRARHRAAATAAASRRSRSSTTPSATASPRSSSASSSGRCSATRPRVRRPASRQLPAARRRPRRLPRLRADARSSTASTSRASRRSRAPWSPSDADAVHAGMAALGYLPDPDDFDPERAARARCGRRRVVLRSPAARRLTPAVRQRPASSAAASPRSEYFERHAAHDAPAAGAADPPHGGPGVLDARRAAGRAPTGTSWRRSSSPTSRRLSNIWTNATDRAAAPRPPHAARSRGCVGELALRL